MYKVGHPLAEQIANIFGFTADNSDYWLRPRHQGRLSASPDAARKIGVPDGRVGEWEAGTATPTIAQLRRAAKVYKRSRGVLFLSEPPLDFDTMRNFRRHVGAEAGVWSSELHGEGGH